jgi:hypothetical protein
MPKIKFTSDDEKELAKAFVRLVKIGKVSCLPNNTYLISGDMYRYLRHNYDEFAHFITLSGEEKVREPLQTVSIWWRRIFNSIFLGAERYTDSQNLTASSARLEDIASHTHFIRVSPKGFRNSYPRVVSHDEPHPPENRESQSLDENASADRVRVVSGKRQRPTKK